MVVQRHSSFFFRESLLKTSIKKKKNVDTDRIVEIFIQQIQASRNRQQDRLGRKFIDRFGLFVNGTGIGRRKNEYNQHKKRLKTK